MECLSMITVKHGDAVHRVPCGKCAFCLQSRRSSWMFRVHHEMRTQEMRGYFLTMTYNEKYVRRTPVGLSLRFRDVQLWLKRIRKAGYKAKYIIVGEYGGQTKRPHYHAIIWTDCSVELMESFWYPEGLPGVSMGSFHCGSLTMQSAMYTLKYIIQPKVREDWRGGRPGIDCLEKTRAQFSRGIGLGYLTTGVYYWHTQDYENPIVYSYIDGRQVSLPRYYRNKIFTKYQMREHRLNVLEELMTQKAKLVRETMDKVGSFRKARQYLKALRVDQAKQIISKTKFNQML